MPSWNQILSEVSQLASSAQAKAQGSLDHIRRGYLAKLHGFTKRNVICYYSGFLSKPNFLSAEINAEDMNGFMAAVHQMDTRAGLDLVLHTPGGSISAAVSLVHYIRQKFGTNVRAIVPQMAMSAGTMLACSCKEIIMARHSQIGPTDPHLHGIPAAGVVKEFRRACREVKKDGSKIPVWQSIIGQYRPTFLSQCENAIAWSKQFVRDELASVMFDGEPTAKKKASAVVKKLTDYSANKRHERPIHFEEAQGIGLKVSRLEDNGQLQDLILTVHHCYMIVMMNTPCYKIIENHAGQAILKNMAQPPKS